MAPALTPRKPTLVQSLIIVVLKLWDRTPLTWYRLPTWTILPLVYLYLRRQVLILNLIDVPQPRDTPLGKRLQDTRVPLAPEDTPMVREADGWGNERAAPGAGNMGATIGRNISQVRGAVCMLNTCVAYCLRTTACAWCARWALCALVCVLFGLDGCCTISKRPVLPCVLLLEAHRLSQRLRSVDVDHVKGTGQSAHATAG